MLNFFLYSPVFTNSSLSSSFSLTNSVSVNVIRSFSIISTI